MKDLAPQILVFAAVAGIAYLLLGQKSAASRIRERLDGQETAPAGAKEPVEENPLWRAFRSLTSSTAGLPLVSAKDRKVILRNLSLAGLRKPHHLHAFLTLKMIMALATGGIFIAIGMPENMGGGTSGMLLAFVVGALIGGLLPTLVLDQMVARRKKQILRSLPDALDLMILCTRAGQSLDAAVDRVSRELAGLYPALAAEFQTLSHELRLLPDREEAMRNFAERIDVTSVNILVSTLLQAQRYGTPLVTALRTLARGERRERLLRTEEWAAKVPALITVPLMIFILPTMFIVIAGPAALSVMAIMK